MRKLPRLRMRKSHSTKRIDAQETCNFLLYCLLSWYDMHLILFTKRSLTSPHFVCIIRKALIDCPGLEGLSSLSVASRAGLLLIFWQLCFCFNFRFLSVLFIVYSDIILYLSFSEAGVRVRLLWSDKDSKRKYKPLPLPEQERHTRHKGKNCLWEILTLL